jgi:tetratricopeptide (TPR) repeat protein
MAYQSEIEKLEQRYREKPEQWFAALADAYRKAGEVERAVDIVRAGLEKRPNYTSGHIVLGRCLLDQLADDEAVAAFERVLELDAENIIALKSLSEIAERKADLDGACRWLERLLDVDPMNEEAREALKALRRGGADSLERTDKRPALADVGGPVAPASDSMDDIVRETEFPVGEEVVEGGDAPPAVWEEIGTGPRNVERVLVDEPFGFGDLPAPATARDEADGEPPAPPVDDEAPSAEELEGSIHADTLPQAVRPEDLVRDLVLERASETDAGTSPVDDVSPVDDLSLVDDVFPSEAEAHVGTEDEDEGPTVEMAPIAPPMGFTPASVELPQDDALREEPADVEATAETEEAAPVSAEDLDAPDLDVRPFDEELAWDAGERQSHEITSDVIEEAKHTHEDALEPPAHYLPGLERAEVPNVEAEAARDDAAAGEEEADVAYAGRPSSDLPLIMPEDFDAEPPAEPDEEIGDARAPEPVVTETMAEVYARQGLFGEASEIYRELLTQRPGDAALERRLAELVARAAPTPAVAREPRDLRFAARRTGGLSVRLLFHEIVTGEAAPAGSDREGPLDRVDDETAGDAYPPSAFMEPVVAPPAPEPFHAPEPPPSTAFDDAFGADEDAAPKRDASGNPAQLAGDEVSLASVFGEEPAPPRRPTGDVPRQPPSPQAASYEDFFGGGDPHAPPATPQEGEDKRDGDDGDSEFRAWLEGLKT